MPLTAPKKKVKNKHTSKAGQADPWPAALRILTRRDHSQAELRQRLKDKGFEQQRTEEALQRCIELGYLDDARYARNRAASLMRQGRAVGQRILLDLRQRGIDKETACQALQEARESCDEGQILASLLERRFPDFSYISAPARERRRVVTFLQRRGFDIGRIMDHLTRKGLENNNEDR
jgi:regulatory protein